ncbi:CobW family GTP-binding protein [Rhodospirillum sp. A1_3_36]|uniref:CobW family GTP-binding protein n=1 Tax=Rhodospirillum sp. A1_3_36 TaxID=3391666 RepID=UPI0039A5A272
MTKVPSSHPTPVILVTGFLGSGKTTLLQRLLTDPAMNRAAVLINEFGEIGLDHHLLDRIDDTVVLMKSGCVCCTVRGEVADALGNLNSLRARGEIDFDRVVIETTGLADPYPILQTLRAHPVLRSHVIAGGVVTTVDAVNAESQLSGRAEAVHQIAAADRIVLTKTDLVDARAVSSLRDRLIKVNPSAPVVTGADPVSEILAELSPARSLLRTPGGAMGGAMGEGDPQRHHHDEAFGVSTFSLVLDRPLNWTDFGVWLTLLLHRHGDKIFRVKGILAIAGEDRPVAIHGVQHLVHPPVHLPAWPDDDHRSRIVFIFRDLDPNRIKRSLVAFTDFGRKEADHTSYGDPAPRVRI